MTMNVAEFLDFPSKTCPDKVAVTDVRGSYTYADLHREACRVASGLAALGVKPGDHVAISCPNTVEFVTAYFGAAKLGAVAVPMNLMLLKRDIQAQIEQTRTVAFICWAGTPTTPVGREGYAAFRDSPCCRHFILIGDPEPLGAHVGVVSWGALLDSGQTTYASPQRAADDAAEIIYSSGTSGRARGAISPHSGIVINTHAVAESLGMQHDDKVLIVVPLFAGYARGASMLPGMLAGAELVLLPRYDKMEMWRKIREHKITMFAGVPAMYFDLMESLEPETGSKVSSHWRLAVSAGAPLPLPLQTRFEERFNVPLLQMLGMAEARIVACERANDVRRRGSVGRAICGTEIMVADEALNPLPTGEKGEILVSGSANMKGYQADPEQTRRITHGAWIRTGDVGYLDADGFLHVVDRTMDVINRGGFKVYPRDVEDVLLQHPSVAMASVVGRPDERLGEEVVAFVALRADAPCSAQALHVWADEQLPRHAQPRVYEIRDELPKGPTGKILKQELRRIAAESSASPGTPAGPVG